MTHRQRCLLFALPMSLLLLLTTVLFGAGCEIAVNISPPLDGSVSDVLDCGICADVSADADYELDAGSADAADGNH